jgi:hypothetical protein
MTSTVTVQIDREKYIRIMRAEGVSAALTSLHQDMERNEYQTFEGDQRWNAGLWKELAQARDFSRELWEVALRDPSIKK